MDVNLWLVLFIGGAALLVVLLVCQIIYVVAHRENKVGTNNDSKVVIDNDSWEANLGGRANIKEVTSKGSRLIIKLENNELVNKEGLHDLGAVSVIVTKEKTTVVLSKNADNIRDLLQK